jgi:hypothetical protein
MKAAGRGKSRRGSQQSWVLGLGSVLDGLPRGLSPAADDPSHGGPVGFGLGSDFQSPAELQAQHRIKEFQIQGHFHRGDVIRGSGIVNA